MKKLILIKITLSCFLAIGYCNAQTKKGNEYSNIDKLALKLPDSLSKSTTDIARYISSSFKTNDEKSRAIFIWITSNIQYDVDNMFAINFNEKQEEKTTKALLTRKGICENYASLFAEICKKCKIKSHVVTGYTKQVGFVDYVPHAWNIAYVDTAWFLFDPTWASGYVNGDKFYKKLNNDYYKAKPLEFIKSHMPFDYMWQLLNYPITSQEFYEAKF